MPTYRDRIRYRTPGRSIDSNVEKERRLKNARGLIASGIPLDVFSAEYETTVVPEKDGNSVLHSTTNGATNAMVPDYLGNYWSTVDNELRFGGARRVENLIGQSSQTSTEDMTTGDYIGVNGLTITSATTVTTGSSGNPYLRFVLDAPAIKAGHDYWFTCKITVPDKSKFASMRLGVVETGGTTLFVNNIHTVLTNNTEARLAVPVPSTSLAADGTATEIRIQFLTVTADQTVTVSEFQWEDITNANADHPSEYISYGVETTPFHGTLVDGVKYFKYLNPVTSSGGAGTLGLATDSGVTADEFASYKLKGMGMEIAGTNSVDYSDDLATNWTTSDSAFNGAKYYGDLTMHRFESSGGAGAETITLASALSVVATNDSCFSFFVEADEVDVLAYLVESGAGNTIATGTFTASTETLTATTGTVLGVETIATGLYRCHVQCATAGTTGALTVTFGLNDFVGGTTAADGIYVGIPQFEYQVTRTSTPILTAGSPVTRAKEDHRTSIPSVINHADVRKIMLGATYELMTPENDDVEVNYIVQLFGNVSELHRYAIFTDEAAASNRTWGQRKQTASNVNGLLGLTRSPQTQYRAMHAYDIGIGSEIAQDGTKSGSPNTSELQVLDFSGTATQSYFMVGNQSGDLEAKCWIKAVRIYAGYGSDAHGDLSNVVNLSSIYTGTKTVSTTVRTEALATNVNAVKIDASGSAIDVYYKFTTDGNTDTDNVDIIPAGETRLIRAFDGATHIKWYAAAGSDTYDLTQGVYS